MKGVLKISEVIVIDDNEGYFVNPYKVGDLAIFESADSKKIGDYAEVKEMAWTQNTVGYGVLLLKGKIVYIDNVG